MKHNFSNLSPADFEELVCDLVGAEHGFTFERFGPGPDGGVDGRHARHGATTILQAKHYLGSPFSALKADATRERKAIERLSPNRYILATSLSLTPKQKAQLADILGEYLNEQSDILGQRDLSHLLDKWPNVEKMHIKLWLSSAGVLDRVIRAAAHSYTGLVSSSIKKKIRVYADNKSFPAALDILTNYHVLIISGPPGVGKTTLAEVLACHHIARGWALTAVRNVDDVLSSLDDSKKQVYLFDDFLGSVDLDPHSLSQTDSTITRLIGHIQATPNARFILASRAHLLERALIMSDHLSKGRLNIYKYVLDVGVYTRSVRAYILYNHLYVSDMPRPHVASLASSKFLIPIVDHHNYNPRVIDWMTTVSQLHHISAKEYPEAFFSALNNPVELWSVPFTQQISLACRHLLFALYWASDQGIRLKELRFFFDELHRYWVDKHRRSSDPSDFNDSVRTLESGFITIVDGYVRFINPSLRDFVKTQLSDMEMLRDFANASVRTDQAQAIWEHGKLLSSSNDDLIELALSFRSVAERICRLPTWIKEVRRGKHYYVAEGLSNVERINLLLEWWSFTRDDFFSRLALDLAKNPVQGLSFWLHDGRGSIQLLAKLLKRNEYQKVAWALEMINCLSKAIPKMIDKGEDMTPALLAEMADAVNELRAGAIIPRTILSTITKKFEGELSFFVGSENEAILESNNLFVDDLAQRANVSEGIVRRVKDAIDAKIRVVRRISSRITQEKAPNVSVPRSDSMSDDEIVALFRTL